MRFVIVGGGVAGVNAARSISAAGISDATIDVYTGETYRYYIPGRVCPISLPAISQWMT